MTKIEVDKLTQLDALGRSSFARYLLQVATTVDADEGAVIGLAGAWGSGKSWVLRLAEQEAALLDSHAPLWVSFSPWALSGSDSLVEAMLEEIGGQLAIDSTAVESIARGAKIGEAILTFAGLVGGLRHAANFAAPIAESIHPGAGVVMLAGGAAVGAAADAADKLKPAVKVVAAHQSSGGEALLTHSSTVRRRQSLRATKRKVCDALRSFGQRVVVVIDDVDRMAPKEVAEILQTVKAVADFPNVVYILAYDQAVTAKAVEKALQVEDGIAYLEKIIQIPLEVPDPPIFKLLQATWKAVDEELASVPSQWKTQQLFSGSQEIPGLQLAAALMQSPRDVFRLKTRLRLVLMHTRDAIDISDLLILESLKLKTPQLIKWIDANRAYVLDAEHLTHDDFHAIRGDVSSAGGGDSSYYALVREQKFEELESEIQRCGPAAGPVRTAFKQLGMALEKDKGTNFEPHMLARAPFRVRKLINWLRWRELIKHEDSIDAADMRNMLRNPGQIAHTPFFSSAENFDTFCVRAQDMLTAQNGINVEGPDRSTLRSGQTVRCSFNDAGVWRHDVLASAVCSSVDEDLSAGVSGSVTNSHDRWWLVAGCWQAAHLGVAR